MSKHIRVGALREGEVFQTTLTKRDGLVVRFGPTPDVVVVQFADDDEETKLHTDVLVNHG
jgi:hypothetical protein